MDVGLVIERMQQRADELRRQDAELEQEQREIAEMRSAVNGELSNLQLAINLYAEYAKRTNGAPVPDQAEAFPLPLTGTLADAAAELLRQNGGEMELAALHDQLIQANKLRKTPNSRTTLWKTLDRKDDVFEKAGRGRWRLVGRVGESLDADHPEVTIVTI